VPLVLQGHAESLPQAQEKKISINKKKISFCDSVDYFTIPNRTIYECEGLKRELWYSVYDLMQIRKSAGIELHAYVALFHIDVETAKYRLYQPLGSDEDLYKSIKRIDSPETSSQTTVYGRSRIDVTSYSNYSLSIQDKSIPPEIAGFIRLNKNVSYVCL